MSDVFYYLKNDFNTNITDPLSSARNSKSKFVLTEYPGRMVNYPVITLKIANVNAVRAGMQTTAIDMDLMVEIRIWARNVKERDTIFQQVVNRLKDIQYTDSTGTQAAGLHNLRILGTNEINEDGINTPKSKIINVRYSYYNPN